MEENKKEKSSLWEDCLKRISNEKNNGKINMKSIEEKRDNVEESVDEIKERIKGVLESFGMTDNIFVDEDLYIIPNEENKDITLDFIDSISNLNKYDEIRESNKRHFQPIDEIEAYMEIIKTKTYFDKSVSIVQAKKKVKTWLCGNNEDETLIILWAKRCDIKSDGSYRLFVSYARLPLLIDLLEGTKDENGKFSMNSKEDFSTKQIGWSNGAEDVLKFVNKAKFNENEIDDDEDEE